MKNIEFVDAKDVNTLEQYAAALISSIASMKTLECFQKEALKKGFLDTDEQETCKTICWEILRLISLYATQIKHVLDRSDVKEEEILNCFRKMMPEVAIPKKRKYTKKKKDGVVE